MMNKKAIAAFAAGATLLAGFAMATPAFAADAKCTPAEAAKITELKKAVKDADKKATLAGYAADEAQAKFDKAKAQAASEKAVVDASNTALKNLINALVAKGKADNKPGATAAEKTKAQLAVDEAKEAYTGALQKVKDYNAGVDQTDDVLKTFVVAGADTATAADAVTKTDTVEAKGLKSNTCLLYTSPSPRD